MVSLINAQNPGAGEAHCWARIRFREGEQDGLVQPFCRAELDVREASCRVPGQQCRSRGKCREAAKDGREQGREPILVRRGVVRKDKMVDSLFFKLG